ncbi:hypothetical protein EYF80_029382 [Liparis tanakae]|uniref:Uncharacterized protein n=1 Tax=Liparis tanakae TaxID=230148 RepID=A0A4Z2H5S5_9TELE|nr:hypothetical protein EYF80_029382 [Liparis tanakae]
MRSRMEDVFYTAPTDADSSDITRGLRVHSRHFLFLVAGHFLFLVAGHFLFLVAGHFLFPSRHADWLTRRSLWGVLSCIYYY